MQKIIFFVKRASGLPESEDTFHKYDSRKFFVVKIYSRYPPQRQIKFIFYHIKKKIFVCMYFFDANCITVLRKMDCQQINHQIYLIFFRYDLFTYNLLLSKEKKPHEF